MEISTIKQQLSITEVLKHYQLHVDSNSRINCPFHKDKTPSMQIYPKTNTAYCFSGNCKTHGKSLDVIDFIMMMDQIDKHQALLKCAALIQSVSFKPSVESVAIKKPTTSTSSVAMNKEQFLNTMFNYFKSGFNNSEQAKSYTQSRNLNHAALEIGYNAGQFHHGQRRDEQLINHALQYGLLINKGTLSNTGNPAYTVFGKNCIVFALRNQNHEITSLYFRSTINETEQKPALPSGRHFYLKDRSGLYPKYPNPTTTKLILTESIIDAATFLQVPQIAQEYSILACYGTNGLNEEITEAIKNLKQLDEIIFAFDNDESGKAAVEKYAKQLLMMNGELLISTIELPSKDVNEVLQQHNDESIFIQLLNERKLIFSTGEATESTVNKNLSSNTISTLVRQSDSGGGLNTSNPNNIIYQNDALSYMIKGFNLSQLDSLKITLQING
jgi:DNA primase